MKKIIGLTVMIAALSLGSMTVYAAPVVTGASCTRSADCPVHDNCADSAVVCDYEGCRYGGAEGCYLEHGNHENYQDCEYYRDHCENHETHETHETRHHSARTGHHHNRTGHGRGYC